jgi:SAP domain-containing ribonucleoprotein
MIDPSESYQKLKIPELKKLLHDRALAISGNKADLIERLVEHDKSSAATPAASSSTAPKASTTTAPPPKEAPKPAKPSEPAAAALAAGGLGKVPNPTAVPNQTAAIDPSATNNLNVDNAPPSSIEAGAAPKEPETPAVDYSAGLEQTDAEKELERRQARAAKFGIVKDDNAEDEAVKALAARAKRFGLGTTEEVAVVRNLDQALPERGSRKRERTEAGGDSRGGKRGRSERGSRSQGQGRGGRDRGDAAPVGPVVVKKVTDDPEEKRKAEQRAKKFGLAT